MMNRREAIKQVTMMLGGVAFTGSSGLLSAVERAHARAGSAPPLLPLDEGAHAARLLHIGDRLHPGDALSGDTGTVRSLHAVHAWRDGMGGTCVVWPREQGE